MLNKRSISSVGSLVKTPRSDTQCYLYVRPTHLRDGRKNKSELRRRDLSPSTVARFHTKYHISADGCWLWAASRFWHGYGQFTLQRAGGHQPHTYAHRVAYVLAHGDIPRGAVVMHVCDVRACVNPDHLRLGDQGDNNRDTAQKGRCCKSRPWLQKITDAQVAEIRASHEPSVVLARRYNVSLTTISLIRRGLRRRVAA